MTQNQYTPQTVLMDGGLDFITPSLTVPPGTLNGCYNFERTDRVGYSRIFGYEPFDGAGLASLAYTNLVYIQHDSNAGTSPPRTPIFANSKAMAELDVLGFIVDASATQTLIAVVNYDSWRKVLSLIPSNTLIDSLSVNYTVISSSEFNSTYIQDHPTTNAKGLTLARNAFYIGMAATVDVPGVPAFPTIGLHGYKDQRYAVKGQQVLYFTNGNTEIFAGDFIRPNADVTDANNIRIAEVRLLTGTYVGGDATGVIEAYPEGTFANGSYKIVRPVSTTANALTLATPGIGVDMIPHGAGMWRSFDYEQAAIAVTTPGWHPVDLGYHMGFEDGTTYGPPHLSRRGRFSDYTTDVGQSKGHATVGSVTNGSGGAAGTWTITPVGNVPAAVNNSSGTTNQAMVVMSGLVAATVDPVMKLSTFDFPDFVIDPNATIKGMSVAIRLLNQGSPAFAGNLNLQIQPSTSGVAATGTNPEILNIPYASGTAVFGGAEDLWGLDEAGLKTLLDTTTFGLIATPQFEIVDSSRSNNSTLHMYDVEVTVYFTQTITTYYFWNGADDVSADITNFFVTSGDWTTSDATGDLQVANIIPVGSSNRRTIMAGDEIRTSPAGGGLLIATITDDMVGNNLDTLEEIEATESRYQFITANFYADDDSNAIYGVSGAGRAFAYDGFFFTRIWTQEDESKDMPRHITTHQGHLVLGYPTGANLISETGNPLSFNGTNGATEIDTGDQVVGYARMEGTTLGIFCKNSIQGLIGTSIDNFSLSVLNPYEGAIEYTVLTMGRPVYCSYRGISLFDQTSAYGDFAGQRLSTSVSPWLLPRIQGTVSPLGEVAASAGPLVAIANRTTNQYCLIFKDGYWLVMTLTSVDQPPQFTIRAPGLYEDAVFSGFMVPRAEASFVDSIGSEHVYLSHYSESVPTPNDSYPVYEFNRSWTFDGTGIPAYFVGNENFFNSAFDYDKLEKIRLHGLSLGYAPISFHAEINYKENTATNQKPSLVVPLNLPRDPNDTLSNDYQNWSNLVNYGKEGRSFNFRFMSCDLTGNPTAQKDPVYADVCPPFVIQGILVQTKDTKGDI